MKALMFILAALVFSSCCSHIKCDCSGDELGVVFRTGSTGIGDLGSFTLKRYYRDLSFRYPFDSITAVAMPVPGSTDEIVFTGLAGNNLPMQYDYVIKHPQLTDSICISGLDVEYRESSGCCDCRTYTIKSYYINNTHHYPEDGIYTIK